jgi:hypothetical protein
LGTARSSKVRDLWKRRDLVPGTEGLGIEVERHGAMFLRLFPRSNAGSEPTP